MGFRFHKSLKLLPGIRLNVSKTGPSISLGGKGLTYNIGRKGTKTTVGLPGSGMSYSSYSSYQDTVTSLSKKNSNSIIGGVITAVIGAISAAVRR